MIVLARSRIETLGRCPRKWFYSYALDGGWMPQGTHRDLQIGIWLHAGMETLLKTGDINAAALSIPLPEGEMAEHIALARALLFGWYRTRWAQLLAEYEIISVEKEILLPLAPGLILLARTDASLRERSTGRVVVFNWKTTNRISDWTEKWRRDVQMWTEALATEQDLGEPVSHVLVEGFYKGVWREQHWATPLIWGSKKELPDGEWKYSNKRVPNWIRFPVWEERLRGAENNDPVAAWVGFLDNEDLGEYFIRSAPIFRNDEVVEEWLRGVVRRECDAQNMAREGSPTDCLEYFKQEFSQWNCNGCPFWDVCAKATTIPEMVKAGMLVRRESPVDSILSRFREG